MHTGVWIPRFRIGMTRSIFDPELNLLSGFLSKTETDVQFACFLAVVSATARVDFAFARSDKRRQISRRKLPPTIGHWKKDDLPTAKRLSPARLMYLKRRSCDFVLMRNSCSFLACVRMYLGYVPLAACHRVRKQWRGRQ